MRTAAAKDNSSNKDDAIGFFKKRLREPDYCPKGHAFDMHRMNEYVKLENSFWASVFSHKESRELYLSIPVQFRELMNYFEPLDEESFLDYGNSSPELTNFLFTELSMAIKRKDSDRYLFHFLGKNSPIACVKEKYKKIICLRDALIKSNSRFIVSMANKEASMKRASEHDRADFFQNACLGFVHALSLFDPKRNVNLLSYASYWMRHYMSRDFINNQKVIRLPVFAEEMRSRVKMFLARRELEGKPFPTDDEICRGVNRGVRTGTKMNPKHLQVIRHVGPVSSLDAPLDFKGEKLDPHDIIPAPQKEDMFDGLERRISDIICGAGLTNLELQVIQCRFGLNDRDEENLETIGIRVNLSKERIRQLEDMAVKKLRRKARELGIDY